MVTSLLHTVVISVWLTVQQTHISEMVFFNRPDLLELPHDLLNKCSAYKLPSAQLILAFEVMAATNMAHSMVQSRKAGC